MFEPGFLITKNCWGDEIGFLSEDPCVPPRIGCAVAFWGLECSELRSKKATAHELNPLHGGTHNSLRTQPISSPQQECNLILTKFLQFL